MDPTLYNGATALSWLFHLIALPFYSGRMAAYSLMASLTVYAQAQLIGAHVKAFESFITMGKELETKPAQAHSELQTEPLRQAATLAFGQTLLRMQHEFEKDLPSQETAA